MIRRSLIPRAGRYALAIACLGCAPRNVGVGGGAPPTTPTPSIGATRETVTPAQLADILRLEVHRFRYHGAPPLCWLEIEEFNQDTLPDRIPPDGAAVGQSVPFGLNSPREGDILLWWRRESTESGGTLSLQVDGRGSYVHGLPPRSFHFDWPGYQSTTTGVEAGQPLSSNPGVEQTLLTFDAQEIDGQPNANPDHKPRRVVIRLEAEFLAPVNSTNQEPPRP